MSMSDIEERLRWAHPLSPQYAAGSMLLVEAADEIARLQSEVERLRGRCGELESELRDCLDLMEESERRYEICQEPPNMNDQIDAVKELLSRDSGSTFWLINRQANAVDAFANHISEMANDDADDWWSVSKTPLEQINDARDYAQRLRQQAAESAGGEK